MDRYGLLGRGVTLSLSKKIHEEAAQILNFEISYEILEVPSEAKLSQYLDELKSGLWKGFNVTTPYKSKVVRYLDRPQVDSVNTLWSENEKIVGASTDGLGFEKGIEILQDSSSQLDSELNIRTNFSKQIPQKSHEFQIFFIGSGGAVLGILEYLNSIGSDVLKQPISFLVRDVDSNSVQRIREFSKKNFLNISLNTSASEFCMGITTANSRTTWGKLILVNAIPSKDSCPWEIGSLFSKMPRTVMYYDLTYPPILSKFYSLAASHFKVSTHGLPMLIEQARQSQMIWWGKSPSFEVLYHQIVGS